MSAARTRINALSPRRYLLSGFEQGERLLGELGARFELEGARLDVVETVIDTFDWRLFRSDRLMIAGPEGGVRGDRELVLQGVGGERLCHARSSGKPPFRVDELPPGPLRQEVEDVVDCRALLAIAVLRRRGAICSLLDKRRKTIARISLEALDVRRPGARFRSLGAQLRLQPVRGYDAAEETVDRWLRKKGGLTPSSGSEVEWLLDAVGRQPGDYSSRIRVELDRTDRADVATKRLLTHLLSTIRNNEKGLRHDLDSEFLHDFRVAVRRSRSVLAQVKGVFPRRQTERYLAGLRWLQKSTNRKRDLDVFLLQLPSYREQLSEQGAGALDELESLLVEQAAQEQQKLVRLLASARYRQLVDGWEAFLSAPPPARTTLPNAARPIVEVASERITRIYRRVLKRGSKIKRSTPAAKVHALRIDAKKLRYLMESFRSVYPKKIGNEIRALKKLQDVLGHFNDYDVQQSSLRDAAEQLREDGSGGDATQQAITELVERLGSLQADLMTELGPRFARFSKPRHRKVFAKLFGSPQAANEPSSS